MSINIQDTAERALETMEKAGFDNAQVTASLSEQDELNVTHNEPSLLRSTEDHELTLVGIVDGRKASTTLSDLTEATIERNVNDLIERARLAPQDAANAVSSGQTGHFEQGPVEGDMNLLALKVEEMLSFRAENTPTMQVDEAAAIHQVVNETLLTSAGTHLSATVGAYSLVVEGTAIDGDKSSSFNYTGGTANDLANAHACDLFGIGDMLRDTEQQIDTRPVGEKFTGDIILAPHAVSDLLGWLLGQLQDFALIADASIYKDRVGDTIASKLLTVRSRFDAPGHAAYTNDGFLAAPLTLIDEGRLTSLLPSFYGSRKTGLDHTPAGSGWSIDPGEVARADLISAIGKGALVNRLSMGSPGANGDFSGVIKNSFLIEGGKPGSALSETMISGNMANILNDVVAISAEHLDLGSEDFPWIRVANLNFS
jgi:PmbA protein